MKRREFVKKSVAAGGLFGFLGSVAEPSPIWSAVGDETVRAEHVGHNMNCRHSVDDIKSDPQPDVTIDMLNDFCRESPQFQLDLDHPWRWITTVYASDGRIVLRQQGLRFRNAMEVREREKGDRDFQEKHEIEGKIDEYIGMAEKLGAEEIWPYARVARQLVKHAQWCEESEDSEEISPHSQFNLDSRKIGIVYAGLISMLPDVVYNHRTDDPMEGIDLDDNPYVAGNEVLHFTFGTGLWRERGRGLLSPMIEPRT